MKTVTIDNIDTPMWGIVTDVMVMERDNPTYGRIEPRIEDNDKW